MTVIFAFSSMPGLRLPFEALFDLILRKLAHVGEYAVLALLLVQALRLHGLSPKRAVLMAACISALYAVSDEVHQTFVPGRNGVWRDVGIDAVGIAGAALWHTRRGERKSSSGRQRL